MNPEPLINKTLELEGGYVNHAADKGGPTNMGLTLKTFRTVYAEATIEDLKGLTKEQVSSIYKELYYDKPQTAKFPEPIQDLVFDMNIHHGPVMSIKLVQRALKYLGYKDIAVDGLLGPKTLSLAAKTDPTRLKRAIIKQRLRLFDNIVAYDPTQAVFLNGWIDRVKKFEV